MAKYLGYQTLIQRMNDIKNNANRLYIANAAGLSYAALTGANGYIVSANCSSADFTIASAANGATLTMVAKNNQNIEGSGLATHLYLVESSASRILLVTDGNSQVLASGNTINLSSWTMTSLASANNS